MLSAPRNVVRLPLCSASVAGLVPCWSCSNIFAYILIHTTAYNPVAFFSTLSRARTWLEGTFGLFAQLKYWTLAAKQF
ncbi:hypothetical protein Moror_4825 [Moniliophthora roreri MCA 2997]|uniref:Uncharacterized protein n=1 Tax=Moniliophthora roreri (strain MCA 2997) TaxID=1381753 RepID=V2YKG9_MONRO|nr:hypothetical protein Moror_4825 [Moniliophthora roreri MCA 2997]